MRVHASDRNVAGQNPGTTLLFFRTSFLLCCVDDLPPFPLRLLYAIPTSLR